MAVTPEQLKRYTKVLKEAEKVHARQEAFVAVARAKPGEIHEQIALMAEKARKATSATVKAYSKRQKALLKAVDSGERGEVNRLKGEMDALTRAFKGLYQIKV